MTVIAVFVDPPRPGLVLPDLAETTPLTEAEAADLYAAMVKDVLVAVDRSAGDLLVNYRAESDVPDEYASDEDAEAEVRALAASALDDLEEVRFEVQVGSSFDARAGNTVTHLLREEGEDSVAVVRGTAAFLTRTLIDSAAMKLRLNEVVLGPSTDGRVYYAGFTDVVDFEESFAPPEVETLTEAGTAEGFDVDYLPMQPVVERGADFSTALPMLNARVEAERIVPVNTATFLRDHGVSLAPETGDVRVADE